MAFEKLDDVLSRMTVSPSRPRDFARWYSHLDDRYFRPDRFQQPFGGGIMRSMMPDHVQVGSQHRRPAIMLNEIVDSLFLQVACYKERRRAEVDPQHDGMVVLVLERLLCPTGILVLSTP